MLDPDPLYATRSHSHVARKGRRDVQTVIKYSTTTLQTANRVQELGCRSARGQDTDRSTYDPGLKCGYKKISNGLGLYSLKGGPPK